MLESESEIVILNRVSSQHRIWLWNPRIRHSLTAWRIWTPFPITHSHCHIHTHLITDYTHLDSITHTHLYITHTHCEVSKFVTILSLSILCSFPGLVFLFYFFHSCFVLWKWWSFWICLLVIKSTFTYRWLRIITAHHIITVSAAWHRVHLCPVKALKPNAVFS